MKNIYKLELVRGCESWGVKISLLFGCGISVAQWMFNVLPVAFYQNTYMVSDYSMKYPFNVFNNWIGAQTYTFSYLYFFLIPLFAALPHAGSFFQDIDYEVQQRLKLQHLANMDCHTGIYNAAGRSKIPFYISGTGLVLNILLDPLFIFGFGLGTNGAAYATWISQAAVFGIFIYQLRCRDALLGRFSFFTRLKKKYTHRILKLGLPVATLNTLFAFVNMFLCRTASEQGGHIGLMTFTTGGQIEAITWNTSQGFSTALSAFIAQNYAAGRTDRVIKSWHTTLLMTSVFGTLCTLLFVFFGNEVFALFVPEQAAYEAGGIFLRIDGYSQLFMMLEITTQGVFYGIGRTIPPAIISITCNYMRIPLAILFVRMGMGVEGIWWAVCVTTVAKGLILAGWFALIKRKVLSRPVV